MVMQRTVIANLQINKYNYFYLFFLISICNNYTDCYTAINKPKVTTITNSL